MFSIADLKVQLARILWSWACTDPQEKHATITLWLPLSDTQHCHVQRLNKAVLFSFFSAGFIYRLLLKNDLMDRSEMFNITATYKCILGRNPIVLRPPRGLGWGYVPRPPNDPINVFRPPPPCFLISYFLCVLMPQERLKSILVGGGGYQHSVWDDEVIEIECTTNMIWPRAALIGIFLNIIFVFL